MDKFIILLEFFGGIILFFAVGWLIGHIFKLDEKYNEMQKEIKQKNNKK